MKLWQQLLVSGIVAGSIYGFISNRSSSGSPDVDDNTQKPEDPVVTDPTDWEHPVDPQGEIVIPVGYTKPEALAWLQLQLKQRDENMTEEELVDILGYNSRVMVMIDEIEV